VICPGVCGGDPSWRGGCGLSCTVCHGSGRWDPPPSAAEEWAAVVANRGRGRGPLPFVRPVQTVRKRRAKIWRGAAKREREQVARVQARALDGERARFFKEGRAPDPALLDQLKAQFRAKLKGKT
jgi:hypothetical protein